MGTEFPVVTVISGCQEVLESLVEVIAGGTEAIVPVNLVADGVELVAQIS